MDKKLIRQVELLMKQDYPAVGFLPNTVVEEYAERGLIIPQAVGSDLYGYLLHGVVRPYHPLVIIQTIIDTEARRYGAGKEAVQKLIERAVKENVGYIRLKCAEDLEANEFWKALGFRHVHTIRRHNKRKRAINVYEFQIVPDLLNESDLK